MAINIGGQAVIEGVMLRGPRYVGMAVRTPDGKIETSIKRYRSLSEKFHFLKWPFLRGVVSMYEMLDLGIRGLIESGNMAGDEKEDLSGFAVWSTVAVSLLFAIMIFVALPYILTTLIGISEDSSSIFFNLVDGSIKILFLVIYIYAISFLKDVRRLFEYHGAEHKVVHLYESGESLTVKRGRKFSTRHRRCGTSFIFVVFFTMIVVFSVVPSLVNIVIPGAAHLAFWPRRALLFVVRLLFIIPVAAISYELLKLSARVDNIVLNALSYPGLLIQGLTTNEPDDKQLKVALTVMKDVLRKESGN